MYDLHGKEQPVISLSGSVKGGAGKLRGDLEVMETKQPAQKWYQRAYTNVEGATMRFLGWA